MGKEANNMSTAKVYREIYHIVKGRNFMDIDSEDKKKIVNLAYGSNYGKMEIEEMEPFQVMGLAKHVYNTAIRIYENEERKKSNMLERKSISTNGPGKGLMPQINSEEIKKFGSYETELFNKLWDLMDEISNYDEARKMAQEAKDMLSQLPGSHPLNEWYLRLSRELNI